MAQIEIEWGLSPGGFEDLSRHQRARLLGRHNFKTKQANRKARIEQVKAAALAASRGAGRGRLRG